MRPKHFVCISALLASSFSVCSVAQNTVYATVVAKPDVRARAVNYGDLNLQRHEGIKVLYRRIQTAASVVCSESREREPQVAMRVRKCESDATTRAVSQVGIPALVTLHAQQDAKASTTIVMARESP